jgi:mono/diheme cytochrome c family protein
MKVTAACLFVLPLLAAASEAGGWLKHVPETERAQANPVAGQPEAVAAGHVLYENHCAQCHGATGEGRKGRPAVRSARVAGATDGELSWLLKNGSPYRGMPTWARLPEAERWELVTYLRSLQTEPAPQVAAH